MVRKGQLYFDDCLILCALKIKAAVIGEPHSSCTVCWSRAGRCERERLDEMDDELDMVLTWFLILHMVARFSCGSE